DRDLDRLSRPEAAGAVVQKTLEHDGAVAWVHGRRYALDGPLDGFGLGIGDRAYLPDALFRLQLLEGRQVGFGQADANQQAFQVGAAKQRLAVTGIDHFTDMGVLLEDHTVVRGADLHARPPLRIFLGVGLALADRGLVLLESGDFLVAQLPQSQGTLRRRRGIARLFFRAPSRQQRTFWNHAFGVHQVLEALLLQAQPKHGFDEGRLFAGQVSAPDHGEQIALDHLVADLKRAAGAVATGADFNDFAREPAAHHEEILWRDDQFAQPLPLPLGRLRRIRRRGHDNHTDDHRA